MIEFILDVLFPKRCISCKAPNAYLCFDCLYEIKQTDLFCPYCYEKSIGGFTHKRCKRRYGLDGLWSLGLNEGPLKKAIRALKYPGIRGLNEILSNILVDYWERFEPYFLDPLKQGTQKDWVITAVPLGWYMKNKQGFDPQELISKSLSKKLDIDYGRLLIKTNKYQLKNNQVISGNVLLLGDIFNTGDALNECADVLKRGGAKKVWGITLAV